MKARTTTTYELQDDNCSTYDTDSPNHALNSPADLIDIGPPRILKHQFESDDLNNGFFAKGESQTSFSDTSTKDLSSFEPEFFRKQLYDYVKGGLICEFCQSLTLSWPDHTNKSADVTIFIYQL